MRDESTPSRPALTLPVLRISREDWENRIIPGHESGPATNLTFVISPATTAEDAIPC